MKYVVALDVGGTTMKGGLVTGSGEVTAFDAAPTGRADEAVALVRSYAGELVTAGMAAFGQPPAAVGLAVPGIVTADTAVYSANIGWRDVPVSAFVPEGLPAMLGHDVRTGGLAESVLGAGRDEGDFLFLPIGTGIAGAIVLAGEPYGGSGGWGGEIGHAPVWPDGEKCACGQIGCLETYASAASIARRHAARTGGRLTAKEVVERIGHDPDARAVFDDAVEALAISLAGYTMLLDPAVIVIGGGLGEAGPALLDPLRERLAARLAWRSPPPIRQAALGVQAGMLGAALLAWRAAG
ncbi:ROK family protein [Streptosporangiaceae bacterium NEAU-GS5]|nr:ROK family protein [Streptosporangiaceae bacterium NEAU-GS5]